MIPESDEKLMRRAVLELAPKVGQTYTHFGPTFAERRKVWTVTVVNRHDVVLQCGTGGTIITRSLWLDWLRGKKRIT